MSQDKDEPLPLLFAIPYWAIVVIGAIAGFMIVSHVFARYSEDTISLSNLAFGAIAALGAVTLSLAEVYDPISETQERMRLREAAEHMLHGSSMFLLASLLKYTALNDVGDFGLKLGKSADPIVGSVIKSLSTIAFVFATILAEWGLFRLHHVLFARLTHYLRPRRW